MAPTTHRLVYDAALDDPDEAGDMIVALVLIYPELLEHVRDLDPACIRRVPARGFFLMLLTGKKVCDAPFLPTGIPDPTKFQHYLALVREPS